MLRLMVGVSAVALLTAPVAAEPTKTVCSVYVGHSGDDAVGQRTALALKERLTASSRFRVESSEEAAAFRVYMVSIDVEDGQYMGNRSALSTTFGGRIGDEPTQTGLADSPLG